MFQTGKDCTSKEIQKCCIKKGVPSLGSEPLCLGGTSNFPSSRKVVSKITTGWVPPLRLTTTILVVFDAQDVEIPAQCLEGAFRTLRMVFGLPEPVFRFLLRFDCCVRSCACSLPATKLLFSEQHPVFDTGEPRPRCRLSDEVGRRSLFPIQFPQQLAALHWPLAGT